MFRRAMRCICVASFGVGVGIEFNPDADPDADWVAGLSPAFGQFILNSEYLAVSYDLLGKYPHDQLRNALPAG